MAQLPIEEHRERTGRWILRGDEIAFTHGVDDWGRVMRTATVVDFE